MEQASAPLGRSRRTGHGITRPDPFADSLDHALERLRVHGLPYRGDPKYINCWSAVCPFCRVPAWTLTLREHGRGGTIRLICVAGCTSAEIHGALERDPSEALVEAAEAREAVAWKIVAELRELAARALELAPAAHAKPRPPEPQQSSRLRVAA